MPTLRSMNHHIGRTLPIDKEPVWMSFNPFDELFVSIGGFRAGEYWHLVLPILMTTKSWLV